MVAYPKAFAGLSGCAMLLFFSQPQAPSETLEVASQTVVESQPAQAKQSGWDALRSRVHYDLSGQPAHQEHRSAHSAQLRGTSQLYDSQPHRVYISSAVAVAIYVYICCRIVAWAWGREQMCVLMIHISREVFDAMLALTAFLPSPEAAFAEVVAAIFISIIGFVAIFGHLSCSPRRWLESCKASAFIFIGLMVALPHFCYTMGGLPAGFCGISAAILVHVVPTRALVVDWSFCSFFAAHARRLWRISCILWRWLWPRCRLILRKFCQLLACGGNVIARGRRLSMQNSGVCRGREGEEASSHHSAAISRRCGIASVWKAAVSVQKSQACMQKPAPTQSPHSGGRRSPRPVAPPKRRHSGALPATPPDARKDVASAALRRENIPVEVRRNCVGFDSRKENIPLETRKENAFVEAQKARPNTAVPNRTVFASQRGTRQSLTTLADAPAACRGAAIGITSTFPIFVDEEFGDTVASTTSPESAEILSATEGHQAIVDALSARLASLRAFKTHWQAGDTSKALPELSSSDRHWAHRDIDKIRLLLENATPPTDQTKAAALCRMRTGAQKIFASRHGI